MPRFITDLRVAARSLAKSPAFAITAVLTLAIGIGASTSIFSVVNAVLLRPLPYAAGDRLVLVESNMLKRKAFNYPVAQGNLPDVVEQGRSFSGVAGIVTFPAAIGRDGGDPEQVMSAAVTTNIFPLLGMRVAFGRDFIPSDADAPPPPPPPTPGAAPAPAQAVPPPPGPPTMLILSHEFWRRRYGNDSSVVGRSISLFGAPAIIVGVLEPGAQMLFPNNANVNAYPDMYQAIRVDYRTASRTNLFFHLVARLKPGATLTQAQHEMDQAVGAIQAVVPIARSIGLQMIVVPMSSGLVADVRPGLLALLGAVGLVLLIGCANVSNLLLVRAASRHRELAVRAALGGTRAQLVQQVLAESAVLAGGGVVIGLLLAELGIQALLGMAPRDLPRAASVSIDPVVLGFGIGIAFLSAVVFGIAPALRSSTPQLAEALRAGGRSPALQRTGRIRDAVVVFEIALSFVLLIGCGLMARSLATVVHTDPGFDPKGLLTVSLANAAPTKPERQQFDIRVRSALEAIPGVTAVTAVGPFPMDGVQANVRWGTPDASTDPSKFQQADLHVVLPGYFEAMHARLLAGRTLTEADNDSSSTNIVIDDLMAAKAFPGQSAVNKQLLVRARTPEAEYLTVVGVVAHERNVAVAVDTRETMFMSDGQFLYGAAFRWALRTTGDPMRIAPAVRAALHNYDSQLAVAELQPAQVFIDRSDAPTRFALTLIATFAGIAAVLAAVGLYGVLSTIVRQRTAEIGVRVAFGATAATIFRLVIGRGMLMSVVGMTIGAGVAMATTKVMKSFLVGVTPNDPPTYLAIAVFFVLVAGVACWMPARRAAALDPNAALREE